MSTSFEIVAEPREITGKGESRRLRSKNWVPGIVYGGGRDAIPIRVPHSEILQQLDNEAFYSHVLTLKIGGGSEKVVLKDIQRHPCKPQIQHIDLQRVSETQRIRLTVPLHFVGEERATGVKLGGMVSRHMTEVEVSCLPKDLPEFIDVDLSSLTLGDAAHLSDLQIPEGVDLVGFVEGEGHDLPVVSIQSSRTTGVEEVAVPEEGEGVTEE
jgi:large subunit ribosomal protein L25